VKIDEERFVELSLRENGLFIVPASFGLPKRPNVVESCSTGLRRIDDVDATAAAVTAAVDEVDAVLGSGDFDSFLLFSFLEIKSSSSPKLNPKRTHT
jgi:hypothetical protein